MNNNPFNPLKPIDLSAEKSFDWVEGNLSARQSSFLSDDERFVGLSLSSRRILLFFLVIFLFLIVLVGRSFFLQVLSGGKYYVLAESNRIKIDYNKAHRGIFVDRQGKILVNNLFGFSVFVIPNNLSKEPQERLGQLESLSKLIDVSVDEIETKVSQAESFYFQPILVRAGLPYDQAMLIKIDAEDLPFVEIKVDAWRLYPYGESMSHLLGYIGKIDAKEYQQLSEEYLLDDNIGKAGLEKSYEDYLRGQHGQTRVEVDALGRRKKIISQNNPVAGLNVVLSLDAELQNYIYNLLKEKQPTGKASIIAQDCQSGEILAMVDYPSYDNNLFTGGISGSAYRDLLDGERKPLFARSILGEYPSGSTIKPLLSSAGLQEKIITEKTSVNSIGGIYVGKWFFPDWKAGGHGTTNVTKAIAWSVNTFYYYLGGGYGDFAGLGLEKMIDYFKLFGLGQKTGIDLLGERSGFLPSAEWKQKNFNEQWYIGDTYHLSIGQGYLLVTPIQISNYLSAIANNGLLNQPHLAIKTVASDGSEKPFDYQPLSRLPIDPVNLAIVRKGMRQTVTEGSARSLNSLPVEVAGKTGTAQWNSNKENHAWFIGFAPYEKPKFCLTILVEEGGEGSSTAVPLAREIFQYQFGK